MVRIILLHHTEGTVGWRGGVVLACGEIMIESNIHTFTLLTSPPFTDAISVLSTDEKHMPTLICIHNWLH